MDDRLGMNDNLDVFIGGTKEVVSFNDLQALHTFWLLYAILREMFVCENCFTFPGSKSVHRNTFAADKAFSTLKQCIKIEEQ